MCLRFGQDGQQERGILVGIEGGQNDHVVPRRQRQHLHHLTFVHVRLRLRHRSVCPEEHRWKLPFVGLKLEHRKSKKREDLSGAAEASVWCVCVCETWERDTHFISHLGKKHKNIYYLQAGSMAPPQRWRKFPVHLKHSEADVAVLDQPPVPLVGFLHQGHQHGLLTTAGGASAQQLVNFDPVLRIDPEAVCEEGNVPVSSDDLPFPKRFGVVPMLLRHPPAEIPSTHLPS